MLTDISSRALALLSDGVSQTECARALGVSQSYISEIVSNPEVAEQLAAARFARLSAHNARDARYDSLEDTLISKLEATIPLVLQPEKVARMLMMINAAKRRGTDSLESQVAAQNTVPVINLTLPVSIINRFSANSSGQVVTVNDIEGNTQSMVTVQSGQMISMMENAQAIQKAKDDEQQFNLQQQRKLSKFGITVDDLAIANSLPSSDAEA